MEPCGRYSAVEMADSRAKGLCMFCDEHFTRGHHFKHKKVQLYLIGGDESDNEEEIVDEPAEPAINSDLQLSINALTGIPNYHTMRVSGMYQKKLLQILIDIGSIHNFLDLELAKRLGCKLEGIPLMSVAVADGTSMRAQFICKGFLWQLQQTTFTSNVLMLPLGCCDLVLGIQWLTILGPTFWDFQKMQMEFFYQGKMFVLRSAVTTRCKLISAKSFSQVVQEGAQICLLQVAAGPPYDDQGSSLFNCRVESGKTIPDHISTLIDAYADIFEEPKILSPKRLGLDHWIPLREGAVPVNQRPYRYSIVQKSVIDKLMDDMLAQGIIQHSNSPYASPIVLVGKKDGSWCLCVDYRKLNSHTIKDRFPIPLIDNLLDELGGCSVYSRLDLRAGYHRGYKQGMNTKLHLKLIPDIMSI